MKEGNDMKATIQVWEENQGINFDIEAPSKNILSEVVSKFIDNDTCLVRIEKQHRNDAANQNSKDFPLSTPIE